jgi:hypothetical protein
VVASGQLTAEDQSHLRALSICHYVYGGLFMLLGLLCMVYVAIGVAMIADSKRSSDLLGGGIALLAIGLVACTIVGAKSALTIWAGACLADRRRPLLTTLVAAISCLNFPLGTALGVCTLIVLSRPAVKAAFR